MVVVRCEMPQEKILKLVQANAIVPDLLVSKIISPYSQYLKLRGRTNGAFFQQRHQHEILYMMRQNV